MLRYSLIVSAFVSLGLFSCARTAVQPEIEAEAAPWPEEAPVIDFLRVVQNSSDRMINYPTPPIHGSSMVPDVAIRVRGYDGPMNADLALAILEVNGFVLLPSALADGTRIYTVAQTSGTNAVSLPEPLRVRNIVTYVLDPADRSIQEFALRVTTLSKKLRGRGIDLLRTPHYLVLRMPEDLVAELRPPLHSR